MIKQADYHSVGIYILSQPPLTASYELKYYYYPHFVGEEVEALPRQLITAASLI